MDRKTEVTGTWERRYCITPGCEVRTLYVQRKGEGLDLWRVSEHPNQPEWLIASVDPICPLCAAHLLTQANLDDGVEVRAA
jgi:hypothetical protein